MKNDVTPQGTPATPDISSAALTAFVAAKPTPPPRRRTSTAVVVFLLAGIGSVMIAMAALIARSSAATAALVPSPEPKVSAAPRASAPPPAAAVAIEHVRESAAAPRWIRSEQRDWRKGRPRGVTFELAADHDVAVWNKRVQPVLTIRCLSGASDVFVTTHSAASVEHDAGIHTVRVSFDDGAPLEQRWEDSADHDALFAPDGAVLARQITRSQKMSFGFTPFNASPVLIDFATGGLDKQVPSAAKACGWK